MQFGPVLKVALCQQVDSLNAGMIADSGTFEVNDDIIWVISGIKLFLKRFDRTKK